MSVLKAEIQRFRSFPKNILPAPIDGFVGSFSEAIGCEPSFVALPMLTVFAAAIGNTHRLRIKQSWHVPPIIWAVIVGESGTQKTPAFQLVLKPVREHQRRASQAHPEPRCSTEPREKT